MENCVQELKCMLQAVIAVACQGKDGAEVQMALAELGAVDSDSNGKGTPSSC